MGMSNDLQDECHLDMLHDDMNISHFMVHTKHVEEARTRRKSRDAKRKTSFDGGFTKNSLEIQDKPTFKKQVSSQVPSKFLKARDDKVSNPKPKKGMDTSSPTKKLIGGMC